ncbi:MAG TPA: maleylpyruvate isomerase N-terminal domain-containing protein [Nocardioides sp.]|nr:maleylpyruvate isomerase N-terminal domain-containing protein [Nocardioides sp.]
MTAWGELYREHVAALSQLAPTLSDEQLATVMPATPAWTVHEIFAHLAGGASDAVTERMDGAPGPEWTSRHVNERVALPVAELVAELQSHQDAVAESVVDNPRPGLVWNIAVHHADLHEGLGMPMLAEPMWRPVLDAMAPRLDPALVDSVPPYELFRGVFSRRSRSQMQGWGTPLSAEELDEICIFGPREDDQPVPGEPSIA